MAAEDVIYRALIQAGLQIDPADEALIRRKLASLGNVLGEEGNKALAAQASELLKIQKRMEREAERLTRAARRDFDPAKLNAAERRELVSAYNSAETFRKQLTSFIGTLDKASKANADPLFNQLSSLESVMARLQATTRNVAPLIDQITQAQKANAEQMRRDAAAERRQQSRNIRQQVLERNREVLGQTDRTGRRAFATGARTDFLSLTNTEAARQALKFADAELKIRQEFWKQINEQFGNDSKEAIRAARDVDVMAQAVSRLRERTLELREAESLRRTQQGKADALARTEANISASRARRLRQERAARDVFIQAGGFNAGLENFQSSEKAGKVLRFLKAELNDVVARQKALNTAFGVGSEQAERAGKSALVYSDFIGRLERRVEELKNTEAAKRKADSLADAEKRRAEQRAEQEAKQAVKREQLRRQREDLLRRDRDVQERLTPGGRQAFASGYRSRFQDLDLEQSRKALEFARSELKTRRQIEQITKERFGADSLQSQQAERNVNRLATSYQTLADRVRTLHDVERQRERDAADSRRAQDSILGVQRRSQTDRERAPRAFALFDMSRESAELLETQRDVRTAMAAGNRELARLQAQQSAVAKTFGEGSDQYRKVTNDVQEYSRAIAALERRLEQLRITAAGAGGAGGPGGGAPGTDPAANPLNYLSNVFKMFLKYALVYQGLYAVMASVIALTRSLVDLQTELLEIQAVTGSTDAQMGSLAESVSLVARNSKFSLIELTKGAKILAQAGVPIEQINESLRATADFAAATGSNLEIAADLLSTTRSVFDELSDDVIANQLAKAVNVSKLTGEDLKTILSLGAQTAKSFNLTSEQFLSAVATLRNAGLKASTVATGLRQGMLEIFSPDATLVKALQERYRALGENLGAEAVRARFFAFTQQRAPLLAALNELRRLGFNDEGALTLSRAFDVRSTNAIKALISNLEELAANESRITFGRGAAEGAATTIDGLNASFTRLLSTIQSFTYSRSEGVIGFFTDVIQGVDRAIQKLDEYDLKQRAKGQQTAFEQFAPGVLPGALGALASSGSVIARLFEGEDERATDRANASALLQDIDQAKMAEFEKAAQAWNISAAQLGEASGQGAEMLVRASRRVEDLQSAMSDVFGDGLEDQQEALVAVAKSYSNLSFTQRKVRLEELKERFPRMAQFTNQQLDRALFGISELADETNGALTGFVEELNHKLVRSNEVLRSLRGRDPVTVEEIEASLFAGIVANSEALQEVLNGTSQEAINMQLGIMQQAQQNLADALREKGQANPLEAEAKRQAQVFVDRIKQISLTTDKSTANADIRAAVTALLAQFKQLDEATLNKITTIQGLIFDAAHEIGAGDLQRQLLFSVEELQKGVNARADRLLEQTVERTKTGQELVNPTLRDPKFRQYLDEAFAFNTPDLATVKEFARPDSEGLPIQEFQANTLRAQALTKFVRDYVDVVKRQQEIQEEVTGEAKRRLDLERAATRATQAFDEARTNKEYGKARSALNDMIGAEIAVEKERLDEAERQLNNFSATDPSKNKEAIERILRAQNRIGELEERRARELDKINREEAKVNLRRSTAAAKGERDRLGTLLANVDGNTPQAVIDQAITRYNQLQERLLELLEVRQRLEGDLNDMSEAQLEEERNKLRSFQEQNAYLELLHRREQTVRDALLLELEKTLSSGDRLTDARSRELGIEPGSRTDRAAFLRGRAGTLGQLIGGEEEALKRDLDLLEKNRVRLLNEPANEELQKQQRTLEEAIRQRTGDLRTWKEDLGDIELRLGRIQTTFRGALDEAFDIDTIRRSLEQSSYSIETLSFRIHNSLIAGIEGIGDAFADALLEGEDFAQSLDKLFLDTGKQILRDVIKTYTTESITGFLKILTPGGRSDASKPDAAGSPAGGFGGLISGALKGLTGGGGDSASQQPVATAAGCGCGDSGLKDAAQAAATAAVGGDSVLKDAAQTESKGFFDTLLSGFGGLFKALTGGLGKAIGGIAGIFGGGSSPSPFGLFASILGFKKGGVIRAATGGLIRGRGTGTSDSVPGLVKAKDGRLYPLLTSNGESILNAKATQLLGEDGVHALNSGRLVTADVGGINTEISRLMRGSEIAGGTAIARQVVQESRSTVVNVSPAQMRMRMGDWLEQHVLEEISRR